MNERVRKSLVLLGIVSKNRRGAGRGAVFLAAASLVSLVVAVVVAPETMTRRAEWLPYALIGGGTVVVVALLFKMKK